ncbi:MAG TPA: hypothetical protein VGL58_02315 [Caulobacteraceae bacterium]
MSDVNGRGERLQIMLSEDELRFLDDWRFSRRMPSRAAAVRELLTRGLAAEGLPDGEPRMRSKDFGVTEPDSGEREAVEDA